MKQKKKQFPGINQHKVIMNMRVVCRYKRKCETKNVVIKQSHTQTFFLCLTFVVFSTVVHGHVMKICTMFNMR